MQERDVLELLSALVDKSLVVYEVGEDGQGRYRLLETMRRYTRDRLAENAETEILGNRAAVWFLAVAEQAEAQLAGPAQADWLNRLETEHDNLRASLSWYEQSAQGAGAELSLTGALARFWSIRGHLSEGRQWLERALERTREDTAEMEAATASKAWALKTWALRAKTLNAAGNMASAQGDEASARLRYEESLRLHRQLEHPQGIASALNNLGLIAFNQGDYATARVLHEESLALKREMGEPRYIAVSLNNLGLIAFQQGDYIAARTLCEECLRLLQEAGEPHGVAMTLNELAHVALAEGRLDVAWPLLQESLTMKRQLGDIGGIIGSLEGMAALAEGQHQPFRAVTLMGAASSLRETLGSRLTSAEQEQAETWRTTTRAVLGEASFSKAWAEGQAMPWEQAVDYVLNET